jgi:hypothetical protein
MTSSARLKRQVFALLQFWDLFLWTLSSSWACLGREGDFDRCLREVIAMVVVFGTVGRHYGHYYVPFWFSCFMFRQYDSFDYFDLSVI